MNKKKYYDERTGKLITDELILEMIRLEEKIPNDLRFPFMTNKLSGSREPHKTQWMSSYFVFRIAKPTPTHSLIRTKQCDLKDQMDLYCKWWQDGVFSATGKCFDIGNTVVSALKRYQQTGDPLSGDTTPMSAGNGSLMRIAPIPIRYFNSFENTIKYAALSSMTTHGAIEAVDACRYFSDLMWGALHGISKDELLDGLYTPIDEYWEQNPLCDSVLKLIKEEQYKNKKAKDIRASGYVMHTLEAVLWAFFHSDSFETGALLAVNLGEDADTTGAIYGQLAGAYYGERVIDFRWVRKIKESHCFYLKAEELKDIIISERAI